MKAFENEVMKEIFGFKRGEVTGKLRKLHIENFLIHNVYIIFYVIYCGLFNDISVSDYFVACRPVAR
jgi:hypothetical protein